MKKRINLKNNSGITLIALIVTIVILLVLATFATYSGIEAIENTAYTKFVAELKIMQTYANEWYEDAKDGKNVFANTEIKNITGLTEEKGQAINALGAAGIDISADNMDNYYYIDNEAKEILGIEGVSQTVLVSVKDRHIVSYVGLNYKGNMYYTLEQLNEFYNVQYNDPNADAENPVLNIVELTSINNVSWKIEVKDVQYSGYTSFGKMKYRKEGSSTDKETKEKDVIVTEPGKYFVKVVDTAGHISNEKTIDIEYGYEKNGLLAYYDAENNKGYGQHSSNESVWTDLSGNTGNATLSESVQIKDNYFEFNGSTAYAQVDNIQLEDSNSYTFEIVASFSDSQTSKVLMECYTADQGGMAIGIENTSEYANKLKYHQNSYDTDRINSTRALNDGKVHHIVGTYDNSTKAIYLYVDGNLDSSKTVASNIKFPSTTLNIGRWASTNSQYFKGNIYSVRVYNKYLDADEVKSNFKIDKARYGISSN